MKELISEEGANAFVHRGIKDGHMEVAVKTFAIPHAKLFESVKQDAFRETFIGMTFQHPNIVRTLGCVYDQKPSANGNGKVMIVMEHATRRPPHGKIMASWLPIDMRSC